MIPENFYSERLERVDMHEVLNKAVEVNKDIVSDQVTIQLNKGLDGDGNDLGEYKNYDYKNRWKPVDLNLTGAFHRSIHPETHPDYFEMNASDPKTEVLTTMYGDAILNINQVGVENVGEFIKEDVQKQFAEEVMK